MKIEFVVNSLRGGGAERVICRLSAALASKHKIRIVVMSNHVDYPVDPRVRVVGLWSGMVFRDVLRLLFFPVFSLELWIRRILWRPDGSISFLVRSNLVNVVGSLTGSGALISERNFARELYGSQSVKDRVMRALISALYPRARHCIALSHGVKASVVSFGMAPEQVTVIYNPIEQPEVKSKALDLLRPLRLISVGRLIPQKEQKLLLATMVRLREKGIRPELKIFGDGPLREELSSEIERLGLTEMVQLSGFTRQIEKEYEAADIFLFSSRYEGFGNVLLEAMRSGLPVVSTDCPHGPREVIAPNTMKFDSRGVLLDYKWNSDKPFELGEYGILARIGDAGGLADAIYWMVSDRSRYEHYSKQSLIRIKGFDLESIAQQFEKLILDQGKL